MRPDLHVDSGHALVEARLFSAREAVLEANPADTGATRLLVGLPKAADWTLGGLGEAENHGEASGGGVRAGRGRLQRSGGATGRVAWTQRAF